MKTDMLKYALWLGSAIVFLSLGAMFFLNRIDIIPLVAFAIGIILVVGTLSRYNQCGSPEDERMRKVAAFSMMNSWVSGVTLMATLLVIQYFNLGGYVMSGLQVICLTIVVLLLTYYGWYIYYSSKGDIT
jgi:tellurite resistance protein TehA-like permease